MKREIKERRKINLKYHLELLSLIFILTIMVLVMMFSSLDNYSISQEKREEYVDALSESKIAEIIGILDTSEGKNEKIEGESSFE